MYCAQKLYALRGLRLPAERRRGNGRLEKRKARSLVASVALHRGDTPLKIHDDVLLKSSSDNTKATKATWLRSHISPQCKTTKATRLRAERPPSPLHQPGYWSAGLRAQPRTPLIPYFVAVSPACSSVAVMAVQSAKPRLLRL